MLTYDQTRDQEQLRQLDAAIDAFITRYNSSPSRTDRKTLILFPGGMGSRLIRADTPYEEGPPFFYHTAWLDGSIMRGAAITLEMQGDMDSEHGIVIPDGGVEFGPVIPYVGFIQWCERNNFDWFVFGWDWRRRLEHSVELFLDRFLPMFQERVWAKCLADPLEDFALIGHSMGGMIVKLILNRGGCFVDKLMQAVTVATPFYGHAGQVHRYFKGDPLLNDFVGIARLTQVISSMRGPYTLLFLDKNTYDRDRNALARDPRYPLSSYPSVDAADHSIAADPYDPQTYHAQVRYPQDYGFDTTELQHGKRIYQLLAAPLNDAVNQKFYNIRGVHFSNGQAVDGTINSQTWDRIAANFNPDSDPDPITDVTVCPGDSVVPAWSARLVTTPPGNIRTLEGDVEHMLLMNSPQTQNELMSILRPTSMQRKRTSRPITPKLASRQELQEFLSGLAGARKATAKSTKLEQDQATLRYLARFKRSKLNELMGRAFVDALKSPSQKLGTAPTKTPTRPKKRDTSNRRRGSNFEKG